MTNERNGTLYTGVTSDLIKQGNEHKHPVLDSFTKRFDCKKLFYYKQYENMMDAFEREKEISIYRKQEQ